MNARLKLVIKSGKFNLGTKSTLKVLRGGKAKLVLISNNCPSLTKSTIEYYAMLSKTAVHHYTGNNADLGTACGRLFNVSVMCVTDPGDSDIIRSMAAERVVSYRTPVNKGWFYRNTWGWAGVVRGHLSFTVVILSICACFALLAVLVAAILRALLH
eukprot:CAMPEP_0196779824 /NCGR_PEP_ID=MMETSP1104-20130614/6603_1 /TAXON_ID=33652 /ORGANISM="Cafeteria sp., Strain Caron Lab Isolate" /LENGTH=156 /DNA_ID=CAMNT_0042150007 /DNA_START=121 /DNA_END=589 /DNA_ORIENTATION=-